MRLLRIGAIGVVVIGAAVGAYCVRKWMKRPPSAEERASRLNATKPGQPIVDMETVEVFCDEITDRVLAWCEEFKKKDFTDRGGVLSTSFTGKELTLATAESTETLAAGATRITHDVGAAKPVDRDRFLHSIADALSNWDRIEDARIEVLKGEFVPDAPITGQVEWRLTVIGNDGEHQRHSVTVLASGDVRRENRRWCVTRFEPTSAESLVRSTTLFTEVSAESGVAVRGPDFDNLSYAWEGAACADVDGDGLLDLFLPSTPSNYFYRALPEGGFVEEAELRGLAKPASGTGALFVDFDNDRDLDLVIVDEGYHEADGSVRGNPLRVLRHEGAGADWRMVDCTKELGLDYWSNSSGAIALDYDNDGWIDLFACNYGRPQEQRNNSWVHADNAPTNGLLHNVGGKRFEDVTQQAGICVKQWAYAACAADWDRDGDQDIYVANDFGPDQLYQNDGNGHFAEKSRELGIVDPEFGMGAAWGDLDNDGRLDLYVTNMTCPVADRILARLKPDVAGMEAMRAVSRGNSILLQRNGRFELQPHSRGGYDARWAWGGIPCELDLDGRLDLFCVNGFVTRLVPGDIYSLFWRQAVAATIDAEKEPSVRVRQQAQAKSFRLAQYSAMWRENRSYAGRERDKVWLNDGDKFVDFSDVSGADSVGDGRAAIAADFDGDGDNDLFVHEIQRDRHRLFRNDILAKPHGYLALRLEGTKHHWSAVGAEVVVHGPKGPCAQVVSIGAGYASCQPTDLLFGLGDAADAEVEVWWPGAIHESFGRIAADSHALLVEGSGTPRPFTAKRRALVRSDLAAQR